MDNLLVDLDKVLDDFEAEESLVPGRERTPSGYQEYLEKTNDLNWAGAADKKVEPEVRGHDGENLNFTEKPPASVRYDFPYEPENFDLSEADFAMSPSVGNKGYNGTVEHSQDKTDSSAGVSGTLNMNGNVNGYTDSANSLEVKTRLEPLVLRSNSEPPRESVPIQADLSPHKELPISMPSMNGHKNLADFQITETTQIASVPSLSSIESNSEYNKYPVQCNTPQTPKENPLINPLQSQLKSASEAVSNPSMVDNTSGALNTSQNTMQDIPKLHNLKDDLELQQPYINGNAGTDECQFTLGPPYRSSQSLPANFLNKSIENTNSSLPTDLNSTVAGSETKHQEGESRKLNNEQNGEKQTCDISDTQMDKKPNLHNVVGFGDPDDVDSDMDDKDLETYLTDSHGGPQILTKVNNNTAVLTNAPTVSTGDIHNQYRTKSDNTGDEMLSNVYSKPHNDTNYGMNLQQNHELNPDLEKTYQNVDMKMLNSDNVIGGKDLAVDPGLEVLKVLPVTDGAGGNFPQNVNTTTVITQPDTTNLSPNANLSIDSGCASMTDTQMDSMNTNCPPGDAPADSGGARPKDINSRINRPNSLQGLPMVNMTTESPFVPKSSVSPSDPRVEVDEGTVCQQDSPSVIACVDRVEDKVVNESRQLMDVEGDKLTTDVSASVTQEHIPDAGDTKLTDLVDNTEQSEAENQNENEGVIDSGDIDMGEVEMRRGGGHGENQGRPRSWSPADSGQPQVPKQKRPTSLNLPPPPTFTPNNGRSHMDTDQSPDDQTGATGGALVESDITAEECQDVSTEQVVTGAEAMEIPPDLPQDLGPPPPYTTTLGTVAPKWVPDAEAAACMSCDVKFTFTKRRHHCRACGKVFCSACCSKKNWLPYLNHEARVCVICHSELAMAEQGLGPGGVRGPHPNNPSDYCSVIPPSQVASSNAPPPSVLVPVLKRDGPCGGDGNGSARRSGEPKQVMFSDGIRPGGDLTELDGSSEITRMPPRRSRQQKRVERVSQGGQHSPRSRRLRTVSDRHCKCLIPDNGLPPIAQPQPEGNDYELQQNPDAEVFMPKIKDDDGPPVIFAVNTNLQVLVKIVNLECCVNRVVWCFTTRGMAGVGQEEIVIVLETQPEETTVPRDIFTHLNNLYEEASKGNTVTDLGHSIFNQSYLGSRDHGGFLYIRATFQCVQKLILPEPPFLFGILLQKWETPWAKVFPLRLLLRLGAEYRYYPCPLIGVRNRKPVFFEIGHTIMNLLADFRNYQYMLPNIKGINIHMEDKITKINFPANRYDDLMKVVNNSNEHVMAIGANFSVDADSHLVCIQNDDGNYQTQAINIQNKPRKVTGASFVVFNGALKTSSGLSAKSSIVEDGLMVQITPDSMMALKQAIKDMQTYTVQCGVIGAQKPDETVIVQWVEDDKNVNIGVKSPIDGLSLDGIESLHVHNSTDYVGDKHIIRWTEIFFIQNEDSGSVKWEPVDLSRLGETLATACCMALTPHLERLKAANLVKIGLRVKLGADNVGYEAGARGERLPDVYMNDLDNELIPVIHRATQQDGSIVLELIFQILD